MLVKTSAVRSSQLAIQDSPAAVGLPAAAILPIRATLVMEPKLKRVPTKRTIMAQHRANKAVIPTHSPVL